jgi:hypothetical protein
MRLWLRPMMSFHSPADNLLNIQLAALTAFKSLQSRRDLPPQFRGSSLAIAQ